WTGPQGDVMKRVFYVAYQVHVADQTPALSDLLGADHGAFGNLVLAAKPTQHSVRVQFTDGAGKPARNQTLSAKYAGSLITTDADGMADLPLNQEQGPLPYPLARPYPGLVVESYREVTAGTDGTLAGLPGGTMTGQQVDGVWYFGLREFLGKADPWTFPADRDSIAWDGDTRTVSFAGLRLMVDTGEVLGGRSAMRMHLTNLAGRLYLSLPDLARLFDQIGYAHLTANGTLRIGNAFIP
ncbi:MAG: hypothetical protein JWN15_786, partial [Firmicutes bacterium]|nr:hypothetical protein [Bacillota bacterium]